MNLATHIVIPVLQDIHRLVLTDTRQQQANVVLVVRHPELAINVNQAVVAHLQAHHLRPVLQAEEAQVNVREALKDVTVFGSETIYAFQELNGLAAPEAQDGMPYKM